MKKLFCELFLVSIVFSLTTHRISKGYQTEISTLNSGDSILSTLGLFKATLVSSSCGLSIDVFNNSTNKYDNKGVYTSSLYSGNCSSLTIKEGRIETNSGRQYLAVQNEAYNYSTVFTIDDLGVMRLIGTYIQENRVDIVSKETVIETFKTDNKYVRAFSVLSVDFGSTLAAFSNERNWKFTAEFGQLTIYYGGNPGLQANYVYSVFTLRDSKIYDFRNQTFPGTLFYNIVLEPRCSDPKNYIEFKPPYVFKANPYWPILEVYEQGGYKILEVAYGKLTQYQNNQNISEINYHHFYSPCPRKTFEFRGDCVASCPAPYYHQIKGESGFCVLFCEEYSSVDQNRRICDCVTAYEKDKLSSAKLVQKCPSNAIETPYGCKCTNSNEFFDGKYQFICVEKCPNKTIAINQICMACPYNCDICGVDGFHREFLECKNCSLGFNLFQGQCVSTCLSKSGNSMINGTCVKCNDPNCVDCSTDPNICKKCDLIYTLSAGVCFDQCDAFRERNVYSDYFSSSCVPANDGLCTYYLTAQYKGVPFTKCDECFQGYSHLDKCVEQCPLGYVPFKKFCVCGGEKNLTINDKCVAQVACPINMYFDIKSHSCLSCPFGCISCLDRFCTACNPGYFLYVSPQNVLCRRKSPLFPCDQQYSWQRSSICMITNYTDPNIMMTLCYQRVPNCQVCWRNNAEICVVCNEGLLLYNNTCLSTCPTGLIKYDNTCILPEIAECEVPHLSSSHKYAEYDLTKATKSEAYNFYTYFGEEKANDPVGYLPYFQQLTTHNNDNITRESSFFTPSWTCLKCNKGFGLNPDSTSCLPCPTSCSNNLCYFASENSCLTPVTGDCNENEYLDEDTQTCLESCNENNKFPQLKDGILYCVSSGEVKDYARVDSAVYQMKDGKKLVYFIFRDKLVFSEQDYSSDNGMTVTVQSFNETEIALADTLDGNGNPDFSTTTTDEIIMLSANSVASPEKQTQILENQYVSLQNQNFDGFLLNLNDSVRNLVSSNNNMFPNKVYGTTYMADHTVFMTTWLAYIGYIMSIVILLLHIVFIGNELLYKVDNLLIFTQSIFYFSFVQNLVGRLLAQFYFGWSFSLARFLPNLFDSIVEDHYVEEKAPISYKLVNIDGNYFRNAGFSLAWLLIYIAVWAVISFIVWALIFKLGRKIEAWFPKVAKQALIAGFEFFSMNLVFFSVSQLAFSSKPNGGENFIDYYNRSQALAIISLIVVFTYTVLRLIFNPLGGIYMLKRTLIAVILVFSFDIKLLFIPLVALELLFAIWRYSLEKPVSRFDKLTIFGEALIFIACYALLYFCLDAGVNSVIISVIIFFFIVYLAYDLTTIYLESRNEFPEEELVKSYSSDFATEMRAMTVNNLNKHPNSGGGSNLIENY